MKSPRIIIKSKLETALRNFKRAVRSSDPIAFEDAALELKAGLFGSIGYVSKEYRLGLLDEAMSYARRRPSYTGA